MNVDKLRELKELNEPLGIRLTQSSADTLADYMYEFLRPTMERLVAVKKDDYFQIGLRGTYNYVAVKKSDKTGKITFTFNVRADAKFVGIVQHLFVTCDYTWVTSL